MSQQLPVLRVVIDDGEPIDIKVTNADLARLERETKTSVAKMDFGALQLCTVAHVALLRLNRLGLVAQRPPDDFEEFLDHADVQAMEPEAGKASDQEASTG